MIALGLSRKSGGCCRQNENLAVSEPHQEGGHQAALFAFELVPAARGDLTTHGAVMYIHVPILQTRCARRYGAGVGTFRYPLGSD
jgi:hypothetical protein